MKSETATPAVAPPPANRGLSWFVLPLAIFVGLAALFAVALRSGDPSRIPSAFIGKPAPVFAFTPLDGITGVKLNGFDESALAKTASVVVVNYWASWCAPCVEEHPQLVALKDLPGVTVVGVNMKDDPDAARRFLTRYGNPYSIIGQDRSGRGAIEWGVYGTPETFILDAQGIIRAKHVGPISTADLKSKIVPAIEAARTPLAKRSS
ncbi:MAG: DsbE family thiol:disulfide interchange protein [Hyphomicrobiaceae bacterium]|nr:DsbE family thiol:disulfide interchange protein [Hyphomicrobiaceae bacterium]